MANDMSWIAFDEATTYTFKSENIGLMPLPSMVPQKYSNYNKYYKEIYADIDSEYVTSMIDKTLVFEAIKQMQDSMLKEPYYYRTYSRETITPTIKAYEILKSPMHWCQRSMTEYRGGIEARCLLGAIMAKWGMRNHESPRGSYNQDVEKVASVIRDKYPGFRTNGNNYASYIAYWNDDPYRRFEDVQEVLKLANV